MEQGTHGELLAKGGLYASLWNRQRQAEKAREVLAEALAEEGQRIKDGRLGPTGGDLRCRADPRGRRARRAIAICNLEALRPRRSLGSSVRTHLNSG